MKEQFVKAFFVTVFLACLVVTGAQAAMNDEEFLELCAKGSVKEIEAALKGGAYVGAKETKGNGPLVMAVRNPNPERKAIIRLLFEYGAVVDKRDSAVLLVGAIDNKDVELLEILLKNGAGPKALIRENNAAASILAYAIAQGPDLKIIDVLLKADASVNSNESNYEVFFADDASFSPLMLAAAENHLEVVNMLIKDAKSKMSREELFLFINRNPKKYDAIGLSSEAYNKIGEITALTCALGAGNYECAKTLVKAGAKMYQSSWVALVTKGLYGLNEMIDVLDVNERVTGGIKHEKTNACPTPLMLAVMYAEDPRVIERLLDRRANVNDMVLGTEGLMKAVDIARKRRELAGTEALKRLIRESR